MYRTPVKLVCACGAEFETRCSTRFRCRACIRRAKIEHNRERIKIWREAHPEKQAQYNRAYREKHKVVLLSKEDAYPVKVVPCANGCGAMVETRCRNGNVYCEACRIKSRAEKLAAFIEANGTTPQGKWQKANPEKMRATSKRYYETHKEEIRLKRLARLGLPISPPKTPRVAEVVKPEPKPIIAKAKPKAETQRLPSEADKLAMFRAAMRKYYGE